MNLLQNHADLPGQNFAKRRFKASSLDTLQFSYKNLNNVVLYYLLTREITWEGGVVSFCNTKRVQNHFIESWQKIRAGLFKAGLRQPKFEGLKAN